MNTWVRIHNGKDLSGEWEKLLNEYASELHRDHNERVQEQWIDLSTGASVVLVGDGTWRKPEFARFRLFAQPTPGIVYEVLSVLDPTQAKFNPSAEGAGCYDDAFKDCKRRVENVLDVPKDARF